MGSVCSNKSSTDANYPGHSELLVPRCFRIDPEKLKLRKNLIFSTEGSESSFLDLSTPRNGNLIKWRRGELLGQGAYAKVFQCLNLSSGVLMAVKHFEVIII
jgi:hypothetical protein